MIITAEEIKSWDRIRRLNLINSITGYKPANLIGTRSSSGQDNLAIFSSVVHLGSNPALLGMITRPDVVPRHTLENIRETGVYTINHVDQSIIRQAHWTSANWDREISEFDAVGLKSDELNEINAPCVAGAPVQMAMKLVEEVSLKVNGTILVIGQLTAMRVDEGAINDDGSLDFARLGTVALTGLADYFKTIRIEKMPYAKVENWSSEK